MAFFSKFGNILKQTASKQLNVQTSVSSPSIFQVIRCMSSSKLYVGGISYSTDEEGLREAFSRYGEVIDAKVVMDRDTGRSRGFAFVTYTSSEEASSAIQALDGKDLHGRFIRVNYANERPAGFRSSGFGGNYGGGAGGYGGGSGGYGGGAGGYGGGAGGYGGGAGGYGGGAGGYGGGAGGYGGGAGGSYGGGAGGSYGGGAGGSYGGGAGGNYGDGAGGSYGGAAGGYPAAGGSYGGAAGGYPAAGGSYGGGAGGYPAAGGYGSNGGGYGASGSGGNTYGGASSGGMGGGYEGGNTQYGGDFNGNQVGGSSQSGGDFGGNNPFDVSGSSSSQFNNSSGFGEDGQLGSSIENTNNENTANEPMDGMWKEGEIDDDNVAKRV